jgi:hypothetical protein
MISYGYTQKQKEKDRKNSRKKLRSLMIEFTLTAQDYIQNIR